MKLTAAAVLALLHQGSAFAPTALTRSTNSRSNTFTHSAIVDPAILTDAHQHVDALSNFFSSIVLSDGDLAAVTDAATAAISAAPDAATDAAATASSNGWFGFLEGPIEFLLTGIHSALTSAGLEQSWGITIVFMTTLIKLLTYPLTAQQLTSTSKMQALQPTIKDIQAKYASNPEVMNQKIAAIYQDNEVNPLAGCIPSILQIPVFIGLYRAVLTLAQDNKLSEPFLWLPNLEGPTYGADPASASAWILKNWVDGAPSLGWADSLAFLSIPLILVVSQSISMNLMATKDQEQPAFLKFLPLMIGWFSLNVPAALGIYWVANNFITTALTLQIRSGLKPVEPVIAGSSGGGASSAIDVKSTFTPAPIREKPAGFGASEFSDDGDGVKAITPIDAEVVVQSSGEEIKESNSDGSQKKKRSGKKKKKKKRN